MTSNQDCRVTAWYSWEEWNHVQSLLYSFHETKAQIKGISLVNVWKSRMKKGAIPVSVELTAGLIACYVNNTNCTQDAEESAKLSTAMAIIRFVNGITDQQQTGLYAQSVQVIADKINIPDWIVDLRHQATHSQLPGFELLRSGLMFALMWLDKYYWEETKSKRVAKEQLLLVNVYNYIFDYVDILYSMIEDSKMLLSNKEQKKIKRKQADRCLDISHVLLRSAHSGNIQSIIKTFVDDGCLVPNIKQLVLLNISSDRLLNDDCFEKLNMLVDLWKPILSTLLTSFSNFIELLAYELTSRAKLNPCSDFCCLLATFIVYNIDSTSHKLIIEYLISYPSPCGFQLLDVFINTIDFRSKQKDLIKSFLNVFSSVGNSLTSQYDVLNTNDVLWKTTSAEKLEILTLLQQSVMERPAEVTQSTRWITLSADEMEKLPPMGEFVNEKYIEHLDIENDISNLSTNDLPEIVPDENVDADLISGNNLTMIIDHLFMDDSIHISDDESSVATNEYQLDVETAWQDNDDMFLEDESIKKEGIINSSIEQKKLMDADVCKIAFL